LIIGGKVKTTTAYPINIIGKLTYILTLKKRLNEKKTDIYNNAITNKNTNCI